MNIQKIFDEYVNKFDINNNNILLKIEHSKRVLELGIKICESLNNMTQKQIELVKIICLFHDIGRFDQITKYETFDDLKSFDHAGKSVEILFDEGLINSLNIDYADCEIIKNAIYYHNKYEVPEYLDENTKFYCSIVRDADKIDILYLYANEMAEKYKILENPTPRLYEQFKNYDLVNKEFVNNQTDEILLIMAFIFDLHFKYSYIQIKDNNYIEKIINNLNYSDEKYNNIFGQIKTVLNEYINRKLGENNVRQEI